MATIIDGKELARQIQADLKKSIEECYRQTLKRPGLAVIQVGDDPASSVYVRNKEKACQAVGIRSSVHRLSTERSQLELIALINQLNENDSIHGILCQLPLPEQFDDFTIIGSIAPKKDVDGFHPINAGLLFLGKETFIACTPLGVIRMLKAYEIPIEGRHCVIVGRSNIVGKPMAHLMLAENATVTVAHSKTKDLAQLCRSADILIAATGRAHMFNEEYVKPQATVIDVGISRDESGKLSGDVDFAAVEPIAGFITPVPGGVGPMTIAMLLDNTFTAFKRIEKINR